MQFNEWLMLKEAISIRPVWHGTMTGPNNEILFNFKNKGVQPMSATGHGQGSGFYVFTQFKTAAGHALNLANPSDYNFKTNALIGGKPLVVEIAAKLHPDAWDIDYEANAMVVQNFLHENPNLITGKSNDNFKVNRFIQRGGRQGFSYTNEITGSLYDFDPHPSSKSDTIGAEEGALISKMYNLLKQGNPEIDHAFKTSFFDKIPANQSVALKYVGNTTLPVQKMYVHDGQTWQPI